MTQALHAAPALVVGFSVHGLAVARALARSGVVVHCLANRERPAQPTIYTRYATVHVRDRLNSQPLAAVLLEVAELIAPVGKIVLYPTSDRIARAVAMAWPEISHRYLLSWSECRDLVLDLQRKDSLAAHFERCGVLYPRSRVLDAGADPATIVAGLRYPLVAKPAQPLSSFKAIRLESFGDLRRCIDAYPGDLPFVIQEWIEGPEPSLYAVTAYAERGRPAFLFTSRKLAASPPGTGQGTVFESIEAPEAAAIATRFIGSLDLTGPVAVEFKRDATGDMWMIEPNVGRTEYCVDLAIQCGFNLPYVEYLDATGQSIGLARPGKVRDCVWFDTDKDPGCYLRRLGVLRDALGHRRSAIFPFVGHSDLRPVVVSAWQQAGSLLAALPRRVGRALGAVR